MLLGALALLSGDASTIKPRLDLPGALTVFAIGAILCGLLLRPGVTEPAPNAEPVLVH